MTPCLHTHRGDFNCVGVWCFLSAHPNYFVVFLRRPRPSHCVFSVWLRQFFGLEFRSSDPMPPRLEHGPGRSDDTEARTSIRRGASHAGGDGTCTTSRAQKPRAQIIGLKARFEKNIVLPVQVACDRKRERFHYSQCLVAHTLLGII